MATTQPSRPAFLPLAALGIGAGLAILFVLFSLVAAFRGVLEPLPSATRLPLIVAMLGVVALLVGLLLGIWRRQQGRWSALVAGVLVALLLLLMRLSFTDDEFNALLFGLPGMTTAVLFSAWGGLLGARFRPERTTASAGPSFLGIALGAAGLWVVCEFVIRIFGGITLAGWVGNPLAGDMLATMVGFPLLAWAIAKFGQRNHITPEAWGYRWSLTHIVSGILGGLAILALLTITPTLDQLISPSAATAADPLTSSIAQSSPWVLALLLLVNGVVIPISEEWAWRGVTQTAMVRALGLLGGVALTALLFAFKHVIIDGSVSRVATLIAFAIIVGVVRARWGTGSSTVTHIVANSAATLLAISAA